MKIVPMYILYMNESEKDVFMKMCIEVQNLRYYRGEEFSNEFVPKVEKLSKKVIRAHEEISDSKIIE